jgi:hypothetical protein
VGFVTAELPYIDEHSLVIDSDREHTWVALERMLDSAGPTRFARLLGCSDRVASGLRPFGPGSTVPGFHVVAAERPAELRLAGRHRYSEYSLVFRLDEVRPGSTRLTAETRARFPGFLGALYKFALMRVGLHAFATKRMLAKVKTST